MIDRNLSPADAAVAVRSFSRRFRSLLARPDDEERLDPDEIARRPGPEGVTAVEHLLAADGVLGLLDRGLQQALGAGGGTLDAGLGSLDAASWPDDGTPVSALLDRLEATAIATAARIESVATDRWGDTVTIAGGASERSLLHLVQDVVAAAADHLRRTERVLADVRH